jgi:uncharacterized protein (DUF1697 family)
MTDYVAFLRGINVGASQRLKMAELREALADAGYEGVRTLGQSGNVALSSAADAAAVEREVAGVLGDAFGLDVAVMVRTRDELAAVVVADPFGDDADDPARYQVSFLSAEPDGAAVEELERACVAPERVAVRARHVYAWHPNGIRDSELAKQLDSRRLGVEITARNWRTVTKMLQLVGSPQ